MIKSLFGRNSREKEAKSKAGTGNSRPTSNAGEGLSPDNVERSRKRSKGSDEEFIAQEEMSIAVGNNNTAVTKQGDGEDAQDVVQELVVEENQKADAEDFDVMDHKQDETEKDDAINDKREDDEDDEADNEAGDDEGDESPSSSPACKRSSSRDDNDDDDNSHPYIGKRVKILFGPGKGSVGTVVELRSRGWWKLDNQDGVVHSRRCRMLDNINPDDMVAYYERHGKKYRGTPVLDGISPRRRKTTSFNVDVASEEMEDGGVAHRTKLTLAGSKRTLQAPLLMSDLLENASEPPSEHVYCDYPNLLEADPKPWVLPPIILEGNGIPSGLEHLDPNHLLQIFDRKRGIILEDRVTVEALPKLLRHHAEYEPIVPPKIEPTSAYVREGRTGANLQVSAEVRPQVKRAPPGKKVRVKSGLHRGKEGLIEAILPGGWYLVGLLKDEISVVMSPECVNEDQLTLESDKNKAEQAQQNGIHEKEPTKEVGTEMNLLHSTFNEALRKTLRGDARMSKTQIDALYRDQRDLERHLGETVNNASVTKQLTKRLDYVKGCLKKAEKDCETEKESAKSTQAVVDLVFQKIESVEDTKQNGSSMTNGVEVAAGPIEAPPAPVGAVDEPINGFVEPGEANAAPAEEVECLV